MDNHWIPRSFLSKTEYWTLITKHNFKFIYFCVLYAVRDCVFGSVNEYVHFCHFDKLYCKGYKCLWKVLLCVAMNPAGLLKS